MAKAAFYVRSPVATAQIAGATGKSPGDKNERTKQT